MILIQQIISIFIINLHKTNIHFKPHTILLILKLIKQSTQDSRYNPSSRPTLPPTNSMSLSTPRLPISKYSPIVSFQTVPNDW